MRFKIYELVGDRNNRSISIKDIAFTVQANAQSKDQRVIVINDTQWTK